MQKIVPHLWYDKEAKEAATFYASIFEDSALLSEYTFEDSPSGDAQLITFQLAGQEFQAISGGPLFKFNPSHSLIILCASKEEVDTKWQALSKGGKALMPLGEYPFNPYYGWLEDQYGLSWQFLLVDDQPITQKIMPSFLFSADVCGKTEEAVSFYIDIFNRSEVLYKNEYREGEANHAKAKTSYIGFTLENMNFAAMDNGNDVDYTFNEAFSLIVKCKDQQEIDKYWHKLSAVPESEQCGWLKDQYGMSWQIVPDNIDEMLNNGPEDDIRRMQQAILEMKKIDIEALEKARLARE